MTTETKTIRLSRQMVAQINVESEKRNCSAADVIRLAIADYFHRKQLESSLLAIEQRITARVDQNSAALADGIKEILDLATPQGSTK